jgi:hypothetical protein
MTSIVQSADEAVQAIRVLNQELPRSAELAARLGQAHAYYVLNEDEEPLFGFSKFVGYKGLTAESYLRNYRDLTGINTEHALAAWFEEVRHGSPQYNLLINKLSVWMGQYGKRPRQGASQKVRLMVLKPQFRKDAISSDEDRSLLKLLIAVAGQLPTHQRLELRAAL